MFALFQKEMIEHIKDNLKNHQKMPIFSQKWAKNEKNPFNIYRGLFIANKR